jgi:hypothetical protein
VVDGVEIERHLAGELRLELADLEVDDDEAAQLAVVEEQVEEELLPLPARTSRRYLGAPRTDLRTVSTAPHNGGTRRRDQTAALFNWRDVCGTTSATRLAFFVDTLTRDIELAPAIIDLVDNSIDGAKRQRRDDEDQQRFAGLWVRMRLEPEVFEIVDACGLRPRPRPHVRVQARPRPTATQHGGRGRAVRRRDEASDLQTRAGVRRGVDDDRLVGARGLDVINAGTGNDNVLWSDGDG